MMLAALLWLAGVGAEAHSTATLARLPATNLLVFRGKDGSVRPVKTRADWQQRRAEILRGMQEIMGRLPDNRREVPLGVQVHDEGDAGKYRRQRISYLTEPGVRVPAYLLIPHGAAEGNRRLPAVLALHPTDLEHGPRVVVETLRAHYRAYAHDLAELGFVVLAPAYPRMADYQPDLQALGYASGTMKAIADNRRGLDLLDSLPFVARGRYGVIGHSLGGHNAIFTAVFDQRIRAVVSSCGFDMFPDYYGGDPNLWQPERGWCQTRYMPRLAAYQGRLTDIPFDFAELLGALAPRPVFVIAPKGDTNFRWHSAAEAVRAARAVYALYGATGRLRVEHPDCGHDFPEIMRAEAYRFLAAGLRR